MTGLEQLGALLGIIALALRTLLREKKATGSTEFDPNIEHLQKKFDETQEEMKKVL